MAQAVPQLRRGGQVAGRAGPRGRPEQERHQVRLALAHVEDVAAEGTPDRPAVEDARRDGRVAVGRGVLDQGVGDGRVADGAVEFLGPEQGAEGGPVVDGEEAAAGQPGDDIVPEVGLLQAGQQDDPALRLLGVPQRLPDPEDRVGPDSVAVGERDDVGPTLRVKRGGCDQHQKTERGRPAVQRGRPASQRHGAEPAGRAWRPTSPPDSVQGVTQTLRLRRVRISAERVRDVGDRLLRSHAVARFVERRRNHRDAELARRHGDDAAADAALGRQAGPKSHLPESSYSPAVAITARTPATLSASMHLLPGDRILPAGGQRRRHHRQVLRVDADGALPRVEIDGLLPVRLDVAIGEHQAPIAWLRWLVSDSDL